MIPANIHIHQQLCQIEICVTDVDKALVFYENVFGWKKAPAEISYYHVLQVEPESSFGLALVETPPGKIKSMASKIVLYLRVSTFEPYIEASQSFGGRVLRTDLKLPGFGTVAQIADPDDNRWGLFVGKK